MLVDESRDVASNSKQYQEEYEEIVEKLREIASCGLNEMKVMDMSKQVRSRLEDEGLTITHKCNLDYDLTSYDLIQW